MISVAQIGDLTFELRFNPKLRQNLSEIAAWGSIESAIERILSDVVLGCDPDIDIYDGISDDGAL